MGPVTAQLIDELGYDPDDGVLDLGDLADPGNLDALCASGALTAGAVIAARVGARRVAVARLGSGRLVVVDDECPHDGGRISDGFVEGERLVCARHGWTFEARNGRCVRACKLRE
jgi:nitrite reductase/ring-hydroxylating ferredoxin subunit